MKVSLPSYLATPLLLLIQLVVLSAFTVIFSMPPLFKLTVLVRVAILLLPVILIGMLLTLPVILRHTAPIPPLKLLLDIPTNREVIPTPPLTHMLVEDILTVLICGTREVVAPTVLRTFRQRQPGLARSPGRYIILLEHMALLLIMVSIPWLSLLVLKLTW